MFRRNHYLDDIQECEFLQDLLEINEEKMFEGRVEVKPTQLDHCNCVTIKVFLDEKRFVKVLVTFRQYPATSRPLIEPAREGELNTRVAQAVIKLLKSNRPPLIRIRDVVTMVQEVANIIKLGEIADKAKDVSSKRSKPLSEMHTEDPQKTTASQQAQELAQTPNREPTTQQGREIDFITAIMNLFSLLKGKNITSASNSKQTIVASQRMEIANYAEDDILSMPIRKLIVLQSVIDRTLHDFSQYAPNEYAFICSGLFLPRDEIAIVTDYYPGEMQVSTPVYCELKDTFIERTIYQQMPGSHNLVIWGHVHPIEGPSGTDTESFHELAQWDKEVARLGIISKRSLGMLVNARNYTVGFYDVHSKERIWHLIHPRGENASYGR